MISALMGLIILMAPDLCFEQELPEPWIDEASHASVVQSTNLEGLNPNHAYCHWVAGAHTGKIYQDLYAACGQTLSECESRCPIVPEGPYCETTSDFVDGGGGSLWKPVSEGDGKPVILMPVSYCNGDDVAVYNGAEVVDRGVYDNCEHNGPRGHWRLQKRCGNLPNNLIVVFGTECRTVEDPCRRYD